ncbi:hypothetical protein [Halothiobacillus sp. DCM-1]|uniref:hypothetical protein n=1 Tax=Halothiobacillus sp. DCM-1 TaxID=3112558 RepID=UPI003252DE00
MRVMNHQSSVLGGLLAGVLVTVPLTSWCCATCGCTLQTDAAMGQSNAPGFSVGLQYDYINQNQLRHGSSSIDPTAVAGIPDQEVEHQTINHYTTLTLDYAPNEDWRFRLALPWISRDHTTYSANPTLPLSPDQLSRAQFSALGDVRLIAQYQGLLLTRRLALQWGVKLPTGRFGGPDASGTGVVGRNPVLFADGGNAGGELLDTSLQPGTGSTDALLGLSYTQPLNEAFDVFGSAQFQAALWHRLDQSGAGYRPGNQVNLSVGARYEANLRFVPQIQLNLSHKAADQGALADTDNTRGTVLYLSPGVSVALAKQLQIYGFIQVPVASQLSGYQLAPRWTATVGAGYSF